MFKKKLLSAVLLVLCILSYYTNDDNTPNTNISSADVSHVPVKLSTGLGSWIFAPR